jgi:hypothetical protein
MFAKVVFLGGRGKYCLGINDNQLVGKIWLKQIKNKNFTLSLQFKMKLKK